MREIMYWADVNDSMKVHQVIVHNKLYGSESYSQYSFYLYNTYLTSNVKEIKDWNFNLFSTKEEAYNHLKENVNAKIVKSKIKKMKEEVEYLKNLMRKERN